jgi:hypothetical protein
MILRTENLRVAGMGSGLLWINERDEFAFYLWAGCFMIEEVRMQPGVDGEVG